MTHTEPPVRVLYILGAGRSGSTLLDIILGNHPDIESVGELGTGLPAGWIDGRILLSPLCACGRRLDPSPTGHAGTLSTNPCPFWASVRVEWAERSAFSNSENHAVLQDAFERYRRWPRLLYERHKPSPRFQSYSRITHALFDSIRTVSGRPIIVDSSKSPARALALSMTPGIDLYLVHLVRDGRGVVSSRKKSFPKNVEAGVWWEHEGASVWRAAADWIFVNLLSEWVRWLLGPAKSIMLRYEELLENPETALARIGDLINVDLTELAEAVSSEAAMQVGHNVGGNRLRMSKVVRLQPDAQEWKRTLSPEELQLSRALMGWLMRRYGYKSNVS